MVKSVRSLLVGAIAMATAATVLMPAHAQVRMVTFWQCSGCKRDMGNGPNPPPQCPHCGALIGNNPDNERVASTTGIVVLLIGLVILLVIVGVALVVVLKGGKFGLMKPRKRRSEDLPIVRDDESRRGKPPSYEL